MSKRACLPCRARKVRCVPDSRRCRRCTTLGIEDCTYDTVRKRGPGGTLGMGEACTSCRKKKRRCDAGRPCTTCVKSGDESGCFYEELRTSYHVPIHPLPYATHGFPFSDEDALADGSFPQRPLGRTEEVVEPSANLGLQIGRPDPSAFSSARPVERDLVKLPSTSRAFRDPRPPVSGKNDVRYGLQCPKNFLSPSPSSRLLILPALRLPTIPRPLRTPLSFFPPENFQVSGETSGNLEMSFRLTTLLHYNKLGIYLTRDKQEALLKGETSNAVIHSFFVYQACSYGMYFAQNLVATPAAVQFQAKYIQLLWEEFAEIREGNDDYLMAQAMLSVCSCSIVLRWVDYAREYIRKACRVVNAANLQFVPAYGRPPEYSEKVRERSTVLSQIIYLENYLFLAYGSPEPRLTVKIEKEFRHELQRTYPMLFQLCPLTMRTQAILLVRDAIFLLSAWSDDAHQSSQWRRLCDQLVALLDQYSTTLSHNLQRFVEIGENSDTEMIRGSCITCLAYLTALCELAGRTETTADLEMNDLCDSNLEKLGRLTEDMQLGEYTHLDLLLGFSWRKSLTVYESRINSLPIEDSLLLRYWKGVVAKAYEAFQESLPGEEPHELTSMILNQDGRMEGSRYPNLLQPSVRVDYGI